MLLQNYTPLLTISSLLLFWPLPLFLNAQTLSGDQPDTQRSQNDTGILSDIWNSLTTVNKTSSCPGECVHAITSIFCDNVLEDISCGGHLFRCCVSNSQYYSLYGNLPSLSVETELSSKVPPITEPSLLSPPTTTESFSVISNNHHWNMTTTLKSHQDSPRLMSSTETSTITESNEQSSLLYVNTGDLESGKNDNITHSIIKSTPCPVQCSNRNLFCIRPMHDAHCPNVDEECCLETESTLDTMTKNFIKLVQQTVAMNQTKNIGAEFQNHAINSNSATTASTTTLTITMPSLPPCDGTCVVPLFHMLCDEVDHSQYCAHGYCCVNREPSTPTPSILTCDGTCLPVILSGMCTKPHELVLKTLDCGTGTICCAHGKNILDNSNNENVNNQDSSDSSNNVPFINQPPSPMMIPPQIPSINPISNYPNPVSMSIPPRVPIQPKPVNIPYPVRNNQPPPLMIDPNNKVHFLPPPSLQENPNFLKPANEENPVVIPPATVIEPNFIQKEIFGCPGKCINSMFKFTCLGGYSIYKNFKCSKGQICCASNTEIEKFQIFLHNTKVVQQQQSKPSNQHPPMENKPHPVITVINHQSPSTNNENILELPSQPQPTIPHVCGVKGSKRTTRVVGGSDSYPGEWCWQIALLNQQNKYMCGGALIGKQWALTAAHCVTSYVRKNEPIFVRVGEYDLTRNNRLAQTQKVNTIYVHHNHNSQSLDNDIALLKLQSPVDLNSNTCLVCLPTWNPDRNQREKKCIVTGYGFQHESGPIALRIREALIPIVEDQECISKINSVTEKLFILPASSFCAGGRGGNDACQGDGGSGLVCESDGFYELTGLVSWGFGCGRNGVPGVYVKVSSFVGWINQIVSTNTN